MYSHLQEGTTTAAKMLHIIHVQQKQIILLLLTFKII